MDKEDVVCVCVYVYTQTHIYTIKYYSALKRKEILAFETTWMNLEDIMLNEIS